MLKAVIYHYSIYLKRLQGKGILFIKCVSHTGYLAYGNSSNASHNETAKAKRNCKLNGIISGRENVAAESKLPHGV